MKQSDARLVPLSSIREPAVPARLALDLEELQRLADDIAANGLHQPIGLRERPGGSGYDLIFGHRRYLAHKLLNRVAIAARLYAADADELQVRMAENEMREDLTPVEQAHLCRAFAARGDAPLMIARYFRRSESWVRARLGLLDLPTDIQDAIAGRTITVGVAQELARVDDDSYRRGLIREAGAHGATERTAAVWAAHFLADRERIVANAMTVDEIRARREDYKLMADCAVCRRTVEFVATRSLRCCASCLEELARALAEGAAETAAPAV